MSRSGGAAVPMRRLVGGGVSAALMLGLMALGGGSAEAAPADERDFGVEVVCVKNNQGGFSRLALLNDDRELLKVYHLRRGCLTFRVGEDLPAGSYIIRHRAPKGRLTGAVTTSGFSGRPGGPQISGISVDGRSPSLKKVKSRPFGLGPNSGGSIVFSTVKNRHRG
jgi:hypothetical protein